MLVIVQVIGAVMILVPFAAQQFGRLSADSGAYLWPNLIGSALLGVLAAVGSQWGFLLLEAAWAAVAARSLVHTQGRVP